MNLVAAEYVACQKDRYGVLVLSEFAGAAAFMGTGSITFNPSSAQQLSDSIYQAATMDVEEKKKRYLELEEFVATNTRYVSLGYQWAKAANHVQREMGRIFYSYSFGICIAGSVGFSSLDCFLYNFGFDIIQ